MLGFALLRATAFGLLALSPVVPAKADFSEPVRISQPERYGSSDEVAVDSKGNALIVWEQEVLGPRLRLKLRARTLSANGQLGPIMHVTHHRREARNPDLAGNPDGESFIVWRRTQSKSIEGRFYRNGALGPVETISRTGAAATFPKVAIDPDGRGVVVAWLHTSPGQPEIRARRRSGAGVYGPILTLSGAVTVVTSSSRIDIEMDADGNALVAWEDDGDIKARTISAANQLGPVETLSTTGTNEYVDIDMNPRGDLIAVWARRVSFGEDEVWARYRPAGGSFGRPERLARNVAALPQAAIDADGDAVIAWDGRFYNNVQVRRRESNGDLGDLHNLRAPGARTAFSSVAMRPNGNAVIAMEHRYPAEAILATTLSADDKLGPIEAITTSGDTGFPDVAIGAKGPATVILWDLTDGHGTVKAAQGP